MDPVGFAVGVIGLSGLVSTCIHGYDRLQHMLNMDEETDFSINKLDIERVRFLQWAESCRETENCAKTSRRTGKYADNVIQKTLQHMLVFLGRAATLQQKYGVAIQRNSRSYNTNGSKIGLRGKFSYAMSGREEFEEIINQLSYFNKRLPMLIPSLQARKQIAKALKRKPQLLNDEVAWDNDEPNSFGAGAAGVASQMASTMEQGMRRRQAYDRKGRSPSMHHSRAYLASDGSREPCYPPSSVSLSRSSGNYRCRDDDDDRSRSSPPPSYAKLQHSYKRRYSGLTSFATSSECSNHSRKSNIAAATEMWRDLTFRSGTGASSYYR